MKLKSPFSFASSGAKVIGHAPSKPPGRWNSSLGTTQVHMRSPLMSPLSKSMTSKMRSSPSYTRSEPFKTCIGSKSVWPFEASLYSLHII